MHLDTESKFNGTVTLLYVAMVVSWIIWAIAVVSAFSAGHFPTQTLLLFSGFGAFVVAIGNVLYVVAICLIDIRNFQAASYRRPMAETSSKDRARQISTRHLPETQVLIDR